MWEKYGKAGTVEWNREIYKKNEKYPGILKISREYWNDVNRFKEKRNK